MRLKQVSCYNVCQTLRSERELPFLERLQTTATDFAVHVTSSFIEYRRLVHLRQSDSGMKVVIHLRSSPSSKRHESHIHSLTSD